MGISQGENSSLLGLAWNKERDTVAITVPQERATLTKRGILAKLAKIYDPLGLVSPTTLTGKLIYRAVCDSKTAWDVPIPRDLVRAWVNWESRLPERVEVPRSLCAYQEEIEDIVLHSFGDASKDGVAACVYTVVRQASGIKQGLVAAKARLSKKGLTIPRLELIAGHMAVNLVINVKKTLQGIPVSSTHCWLDSSVALYWIKGQGEYKQFVSNRVRKINSHEGVTWRHVPTEVNPADLGSRGGYVTEAALWWDGPPWLANQEDWPADIVSKSSSESKAEAKVVREVLSVGVNEMNEIDDLMQKFSLRKAVRVCAWIRRFAHNSLSSRGTPPITGPLTTDETSYQMLFWTKQTQESCNLDEDRVALNLQLNHDGLLECRGRVQGEYPIYLPDTHNFSQRVVEEAHKQTLHGGVGLTMANVRAKYWIPRLRRLVKKVRGKCHGCKRFQAMAYAVPPTGADYTNSRH